MRKKAQQGGIVTFILVLAAIVGILAATVVILDYIGVGFTDFIPDRVTDDDNDEINDDPIKPESYPFDINKLGISLIKPIRSNFYSGSLAMILYEINYPYPVDKDNVTLLSLNVEWFINGDDLPSEWSGNLSAEKGSQCWYSWWPLKTNQNIGEYKARVLVEKDKEWHDVETSFNVISNEELLKYLAQDEYIAWDQNVYHWIINNSSCKFKELDSEEEQAKLLFDLVWKNMKIPGRTKLLDDYNKNVEQSLKSFNDELGTSSEFSFVYTMFLRAFGIPAKYEKIDKDGIDYYSVYYFSGQEWIHVDVYNPDFFN